MGECTRLLIPVFYKAERFVPTRYGRHALARISAGVDGMLSEGSVGASKREPALLPAGDPQVGRVGHA